VPSLANFAALFSFIDFKMRYRTKAKIDRAAIATKAKTPIAIPICNQFFCGGGRVRDGDGGDGVKGFTVGFAVCVGAATAVVDDSVVAAEVVEAATGSEAEADGAEVDEDDDVAEDVADVDDFVETDEEDVDTVDEVECDVDDVDVDLIVAIVDVRVFKSRIINSWPESSKSALRSPVRCCK